MPQATVAKADARALDVRQLSRIQPACAVLNPRPGEAPDPRFLRFIAEYGALPVDLAARLMRCPESKIVKMIEQGVKLGWIRLREYPGELHPWAVLRRGGLFQVGEEFGRRSTPRPGLLTHRREIVEVHLLLREEKRGWRWICERLFARMTARG